MAEQREPDRILLERLNRGDPGALECVFRRYYAPLVRYAVRFTADPGDAEDIVSDVFAAVWERRGDLGLTTSVKAYLYTAVRNRAVRRARTVERRKLLLEEEVDVAPPAPVDPHSEAERDELRQRVERAIAALPERARETLQLRRQHGLTYKEIAQAMEISRKTVENHLSRARNLLRELLSDLELP